MLPGIGTGRGCSASSVGGAAAVARAGIEVLCLGGKGRGWGCGTWGARAAWVA